MKKNLINLFSDRNRHFQPTLIIHLKTTTLLAIINLVMLNNISNWSQLETCWLIRSFGYYLTTIWILGTLLNGSILFLFIRHKKLRQTSTNIFIGGLLLADFFGALIPTPITAISMLHCR